MEFFDALFSRYSYRGPYKSDPVPKKDLTKMLEAGLAAPSGCNRQTTALIALDDPELIARVSAPMDKPHFASAPAAICVLAKHIPGYDNVYFDVQDYSAAIQNVLLAVTALGYASCWVEGHITAEGDEMNRQMSEMLNVPEGYRLVAYLPIGIPESEGKRVKKQPFAERAWFNLRTDSEA